MDIKTKSYDFLMGWVQDSYVMLTHSEMPVYSKGDFEVLSLDIIESLPTGGEREDRIAQERGQYFVNEHKRMSRKLTNDEIPRRLSSDNYNVYVKMYHSIYHINIKATNSWEAAHRHYWDVDTLHNCLEYLRKHLSQREQVTLVPYNQFQNIYFLGSGGFNYFASNAKKTDINLAKYKNDKQTTQLLLDYFFINVNTSYDERYEFIIRNED
jgi:hypothetical protein